MNYRDVIPQKYLDKFDAYYLNVAGYMVKSDMGSSLKRVRSRNGIRGA